MADEPLSTKRLLTLRRLTRAVGDHLRGQLRDVLAVLTPQFQAKPHLGDFLEGPRGFLKSAEANFAQLKSAYDAIAGRRPFNLPADMPTPISLASQTPEIQPIEYAHQATAGGQTKAVAVTAPLRFALTYTGFAPRRLRDMLAGSGFASDMREFVVHTLVVNLLIDKQPGLARLFEALRFPLSIGKLPGCGDLPFVLVSAAVPTILPPDDVIIESTEISGSDAFEEVIDVAALARLDDPFKARLVDIAKQHGETI